MLRFTELGTGFRLLVVGRLVRTHTYAPQGGRDLDALYPEQIPR